MGKNFDFEHGDINTVAYPLTQGREIIHPSNLVTCKYTKRVGTTLIYFGKLLKTVCCDKTSAIIRKDTAVCVIICAEKFFIRISEDLRKCNTCQPPVGKTSINVFKHLHINQRKEKDLMREAEVKHEEEDGEEGMEQ